MSRVRVVVVDDSAFARKVMREVLAADPRIEVLATARDGLDALEKVAELKPDVLALDLVMPNLDGVGVLDALRALPSPPRVVVVTMSDADSPLGVAALQAGAFDVVHKPTALATDRLYELGAELAEKVVLASRAAFGTISAVDALVTPIAVAPIATSGATRFVVVGASTGGPRAVTLFLRALPQTFPVPICIVVHMPPGYTDAFARRLDRECQLEVVEASEGMELRAGRVVIARAGIHLRVGASAGGWVAALDPEPSAVLHRPSVDVLFQSAAATVGRRVLGVVMTGMGDDGLAGARAIGDVGGRVLVEDASTCVVYGMPRAIAAASLALAEVPIHEMAAAVLSHL